ncbi:MAG: carbohydrate kinase [Anaerolineae bacterium]|nr:carbohydrate kinase [Anaerolineae bacterium]
MPKPFLLGIDQGTSGSRALILDDEGQVRGYGYRPLARLYPQPGWVEQDPDAVVAGVAEVIAEAIDRAGCRPGEIAAGGIACQRNTDFIWDARTRRPTAPAITWQDLRTMPLLTELAAWPQADQRRQRLGYFPGPYSSSLHLAWRMRNNPEVAAALRADHARIGFSAAWLLAAMGQPRSHVMDFSLVQAMGLYDFRAGRYWNEWLDLLGIPPVPLPQAVPTISDFGTLAVTASAGLTADIPILAMIGDQQSALFGYDCRSPGDAECTLGTASFVNVCLGNQAPESDKVNIYFAWSLPMIVDRRPPSAKPPFGTTDHQTTTRVHQSKIPKGRDSENPKSTPEGAVQNLKSKIVHTYCLEAETAATGSAIRWMQEHARFTDHYTEVGPLAASVPDSAGVVFVPAFTGLFVPYNDPTARGAILGMTLGSTRAHIVRAFVEALAFQVRAILETIEAETGLRVEQLKLGGGVSSSNEVCQIMADQLGLPLIRPGFAETTARAAALLAGLSAGVWPALSDLPPLPGDYTTFEPRLSADQRDAAYAQWQRAVDRAKGWNED